MNGFMPLLEPFLSPSRISLKICGITTAADAQLLLDAGVDALGVNFWPHSKRFIRPDAAAWLKELNNRILRVGVFVNPNPEEAIQLVKEGWIDVVQLHGDESPDEASPYLHAGIPFIKAIGVRTAKDTELAACFGASAILLDAHAPGIYGGTGATFDWNDASTFQASHPDLPLLLAGGITTENALQACLQVRPAAIDVASGAESSPGTKDAEKIRALTDAVRKANLC